MNWFENLIADLINLLALGLQGLTGLGLGDVIIRSIFPDPNKVPTLGTAWFSDVMSPKALSALGPLAQAFWALGWAFFVFSIYIFATQIASAANSAVQRDRLKQGAVRILLAALMIWEGPRFALLISQGFFYATEYFLSISGSIKLTSLGANGDQALLNSSVNLFSAIMALIVWIIYEFRKIFLYAWMIFFPLAMAFYANDKTRNVAKMWWWEWTYQMAVPLGQAIVYGIAVAIAKPDKAGAALTASDVFAALAGVIGLISSAVYVRKIMDAIAQNFGASVIGFNAGERLGQMAAMGAAFGLGDMGAKMGIKGAAGVLGKPMKGLFQKVDNLPFIRGAAENAIKKQPELFSQAIQSGAGIDDIMLHHQMGAFGDALNASGAGLEAAGAVTPGRGVLGGASRSSGRPMMRHPLIPHLQTAGAIRDVKAGVKNTLANSNMALAAKGALHGLQTSGGVPGRVGKAVASGITATPGLNRVGFVSNRAHNYLARAEAKQQRLSDMREHMRGVMETNAAAQRLPNINHLYDKESNQFTGPSDAEQAYSGARQTLVSTLQQSMSLSYTEANTMVRDWQGKWDTGRHVSVRSFTPDVQTAYRRAFSLYQPAAMDTAAKDVVRAGQLTIKSVDPHHNMKHGTHALLNDARRALVQGK